MRVTGPLCCCSVRHDGVTRDPCISAAPPSPATACTSPEGWTRPRRRRTCQSSRFSTFITASAPSITRVCVSDDNLRRQTPHDVDAGANRCGAHHSFHLCDGCRRRRGLAPILLINFGWLPPSCCTPRWQFISGFIRRLLPCWTLANMAGDWTVAFCLQHRE